jgi:DNA-binding response OmpR family regulator
MQPREKGNGRLRAKPRVLIVDDEEVISDTLAMILNQAGFEARAVYSGETALETAQTFEPDVLISDVIMPGISGIETAIRLRRLLPSSKIFLVSGRTTPANMLEEAQAQGYEFETLDKPVHPSNLLARLRAAMPDHPGLAAPDRA